MKLAIDPRNLRRIAPWEYALRFAFGGVITACAGLIAHRWGPLVGGLFLAFPAILPASLTLVKDHAGRTNAVDDARGGRIGALGLMAFALVLRLVARTVSPVGALAAASVAWLVVALATWSLVFGWRERSG